MREAFDFLSLRIDLKDTRPQWVPPGRLCWRFFANPTIETWDWRFSRVLLHETLHFWQMLGSRYLSDLVDCEWARFQHYEKRQEVFAPSPSLALFREPHPETDFSNEQLMEAWARFWEVHVQSPRRLLDQEGVDPDEIFPAVLELIDPQSPFFKYPWVGIEIAMTQGRHCDLYGGPYRWLLDRIKLCTGNPGYSHERFVPNNSNPSFAAAILFPILAYHSFQSPDPSSFFAEAVRRLCDARLPNMLRLGLTSGAVEIEWFRNWDRIAEHLDGLAPEYRSHGRLNMAATSASNHPPAPWKAFSIEEAQFEQALHQLGEGNPHHPFFQDPRLAFERHGAPIAYAFMGFEDVRRALSIMAPPPFIMFANGPEFSVAGRLRGPWDELAVVPVGEPAYGLADLARRVDRFRRAEKAVSLGLPHDAFESG